MAGAKPYMPDPSFRFQGDGIMFKAKLFGTADVNEPKGDLMCQTALNLLKAAVKVTGEHKQKIFVRVNLNGITLLDQVNQLKLYEHPVNRISFIAKDNVDNRAFGYVVGDTDGKHVFYGIKTERPAEQVVLTLRDLFQVVYDLKKKEAENKTEQAQIPTATEVTAPEAPGAYVTAGQPIAPPTVAGVTDNTVPQPAMGPNEPVKQEQSVKRQDSAGHLLDLLADLTFEPVVSQPTATQSAAFATSDAWPTTQAQNDPFVVNQQQPSQTNPNGLSHAAPVQTQSQPFQQQPFTNPQQPSFVNQQPQQQPFMGQPPEQPFMGQPQQQPFMGQPPQQPFMGQPPQQQPFMGQPPQQQAFTSPTFGAQPQQLFQPNPYQQPQANQSTTLVNRPMANGNFQPAQQQPVFGQQSQNPQPQSVFGQDPFFTSQAQPQQPPPVATAPTNPFNAPVLQPQQIPTAIPQQSTKPDLFSDLNPLPGTQPPKSRDPFAEVKNPPKPKLNDMMPQQQQTAVSNNNGLFD